MKIFVRLNRLKHLQYRSRIWLSTELIDWTKVKLREAFPYRTMNFFLYKRMRYLKKMMHKNYWSWLPVNSWPTNLKMKIQQIWRLLWTHVDQVVASLFQKELSKFYKIILTKWVFLVILMIMILRNFICKTSL
jgi:hypothetical protein